MTSKKIDHTWIIIESICIQCKMLNKASTLEFEKNIPLNFLINTKWTLCRYLSVNMLFASINLRNINFFHLWLERQRHMISQKKLSLDNDKYAFLAGLFMSVLA